MPIVVGQTVVFKCPRCEKSEVYAIRKEDIDEVVSFDVSRVGFFHGDHILLCGIDKKGNPTIKGVETTNFGRILTENRVYVRGFLVIYSGEPIDELGVIFVDPSSRRIDLRLSSRDIAVPLSFLYKHFFSLLVKYEDMKCVVVMVDDFDIIKFDDLYLLVKIGQRKHSKDELRAIETIFIKALGKPEFLVESEVPRGLEEIYARYSWYAVMLRYVFPKGLDDELLKVVVGFVNRKIGRIPNMRDLEHLKTIVDARNIVVELNISPQVLRLTKPVAILYGVDADNIFETIIDGYKKNKIVALIDLLVMIKPHEVEEFLEFIDELKKRGAVSLRHITK